MKDLTEAIQNLVQILSNQNSTSFQFTEIIAQQKITNIFLALIFGLLVWFLYWRAGR